MNWNRKVSCPYSPTAVAPSRVRELKLGVASQAQSLGRRTFTGAWIETFFIFSLSCITSSHLHGCVNWNMMCIPARLAPLVAPSRVRELKPKYGASSGGAGESLRRTFTGAWIETRAVSAESGYIGSHLHGCVNWNTFALWFYHCIWVAPSRVRELKHNRQLPTLLKTLVAPSRVRELKQPNSTNEIFIFSRTFTGAWIETFIWENTRYSSVVAPSRVRELKPTLAPIFANTCGSHLHGCVNWNAFDRFIKTPFVSHLHGCVNWNWFNWCFRDF